MKHTQKHIPEVKLELKKYSKDELRKIALELYKKKISGKSIINKHLGHKIEFTNKPGGRKVSYGGSIYIEKVLFVTVIDKLLENAIYNNFGTAKTSDNNLVVGYLNFKVKGKINGKIYHLRISVQLRKNGKLYYNHEINLIKKRINPINSIKLGLHRRFTPFCSKNTTKIIKKYERKFRNNYTPFYQHCHACNYLPFCRYVYIKNTPKKTIAKRTKR